MKTICLITLLAPLLAQTAPVQTEWERLGITGLSIGATVAVWRYFNARQDAKEKAEKEAAIRDKAKQDSRDAASIAERDRLLTEGNAKNQQIIDILKSQLEDSRDRGKREKRISALEQTTRHMLPRRDTSADLDS